MRFEKSEQWLQQSKLLLEARPSTTRITTKYHIIDPSKKPKKSRPRPQKDSLGTDESTANATPGPRAVLVLKTFDTASGACLSYQTNKAAEVGRLFAALNGLGRVMAALPELAEDATPPEAATTERGTGTSTPVPDAAKGAGDAKNTSGAGGGGGKKKKKGKR